MFSQAEQVPIAFHLAETREELELLAVGSGPLDEFFRKIGFWRDGVIAPGSGPRNYLHALQLVPHVHGVEPPISEWGQMLVDGMSYLEDYPRLVIAPGIALTLVVVSFNLLGEQFALQKVPRALRGFKLKRMQRLRKQEEDAISTGKANS